MYTLPKDDLEKIESGIIGIMPQRSNFLITGATGFFGRWIVEAIGFLEAKNMTGNTYHIVSRQNGDDLKLKIPVLKAKFFHLHQFDLKQAKAINSQFDYILHGAADVSGQKQSDALSKALLAPATSIKFFLDLLKLNASAKFLFLSSGGVYEPKKQDQPFFETDPIQAVPNNIYASEKIQIENVLSNHAHEFAIRIARCFSFVGPFADEKMAVMDMISKKVTNTPIKVGSPLVKRSYMYPTDLIINLFNLLLAPKTDFSIYNIGSPIPIALGDLGHLIDDLVRPNNGVDVGLHSVAPALAGQFYYPNTDRFDTEFNKSNSLDLKMSLLKTINFKRHQKVI